MIQSQLEGRSVIVVGAGGGGIGTAISTVLAEAGAHVVAVDRDESRLAIAVEALEAKGGHFTPEVCDARDADALGLLIERSDAGGDELSGMVNVVGGLTLARWQPLLAYDDDNLDDLLETNLKISLRASRAFARHLVEKERPGSIVQIASIAALEGMPFGAGYSASKAALVSLMRTMALEWGRYEIRVNAVAPGSIRVPRNQASDDADRDRRTIPLGRRGRPEDIAGAVLFLLSGLSSWVTGQLLAVDGGASIKPSYLDDDGLPVFVRDEELRRRLLDS